MCRKRDLPRDDHINEVLHPPSQHPREPQRIDLLFEGIAFCFFFFLSC